MRRWATSVRDSKRYEMAEQTRQAAQHDQQAAQRHDLFGLSLASQVQPWR